MINEDLFAFPGLMQAEIIKLRAENKKLKQENEGFLLLKKENAKLHQRLAKAQTKAAIADTDW